MHSQRIKKSNSTKRRYYVKEDFLLPALQGPSLSVSLPKEISMSAS